MRPIQQWEAKQWLEKRIAGILMLVPNFPARGTATKRQILHSREPFSNLENRRISDNARALRDAIDGDTEAYASLTVILAGNVLRIAQERQWQRVDMPQGLRVANALLAMVTAEKYPTDMQLAGLIGVADRNYRATWKPRMQELYLRCIKPMLSEIA